MSRVTVVPMGKRRYVTPGDSIQTVGASDQSGLDILKCQCAMKAKINDGVIPCPQSKAMRKRSNMKGSTCEGYLMMM